MARHRDTKRNRRSLHAKALRRRVAGLIGSAGAFVAFGLGPLGVAPAAHADEFDVIVDPIISALSSVDPALAADVSTVLGDVTTSSGWESVVADLGGVDSALGAASSAASVVPDTSSVASASADLGSSSDAAAVAWFDQYVSVPLHTDMENWINSPLGEHVDGFINQVSGQDLIGNGADGTAANPDGGNAGLWFGDGGNGYAGGDGGNGGFIIGNGGDGGNATDGGSGAAPAALSRRGQFHVAKRPSWCDHCQRRRRWQRRQRRDAWCGR